MSFKHRQKIDVKIKNIEKQKQPFPDIVKKLILETDIIIEVLDARFIEETINEDLEKEIKNTNKKIIYVLNKIDLADIKKSKEIINKLKIQPYTLVSCKKRVGIRELRNRIKIESLKIQKDDRINVAVIGYPNIGKSSLINLLIGRSSAKTAPQPGTTRGIQKIKLSGNIVLLDSPGVIPRKESLNSELENLTKRAKIGMENYNIVKNPELVVNNLMKENPRLFEKFYNIKAEDSDLFLEKLGRRRNFLKKGNQVDTDRTAKLILKDWQNGKLERKIINIH